MKKETVRKNRIVLIVDILVLFVLSSVILACIPLRQKAEEVCKNNDGVYLTFTGKGKEKVVCNNTRIFEL